nr:MOSC domain-containing protein [Micromonospora sp. DSM 115978]
MGSDGPRIARLYRYPVKGLSPQPLASLDLVTGQGVPYDRIFALARPTTEFDEAEPKALPKQKFFMLQRDEVLARIRTSYDERSGRLHLAYGGPRVGDSDTVNELTADLADAADRARVESFVAAVLALGPDDGAPRLVAALGAHRFTDAGAASAEFMQAVSVVNLATVRELGDRIGVALDPLRFRANIYLDGIEPWAELDWIGRTIGLGAASAQVLSRTPRCAATAVNPTTGERDVKMLKELASNYGHTDCGCYVSVRTDGAVSPGDPVTI